MRRRCARILRRSLPDYMVPSAFVVLERLPLTAERQARPQGAAGAGPAPWRVRAAAHAAGGDPVRAVCRGAGARARRHRRQLLRAGRPFAAGDAADQPHPRHARMSRSRSARCSKPDRGGSGRASCTRARRRVRRCVRCRVRRRSRCRLRSAGSGSSPPGRSERDLHDPAGAAAARARSTMRRWRRRWAIVVERHESLRTIFPDTLGVPRQLILEAAAARPRLEVVAVS